jgi:energy-converting hydrogenase Eha subunit A
MQVEEYEITLGEGVGKRVMALRLLAGLAQGIVLYWLYHASKNAVWPATAPFVMVPLAMLALILPVLLISSVGHLAPRKAGIWLLTALAILLAISLNDAWRGQTARPFLGNWEGKAVYSPSETLVFFGLLFFFIAQALVLAGARANRRVASYDTYFETAWKLAIQLMFSVLFVGALFLVLFVGAELFMLVKLRFLRELMRESWFNVPVICSAFSCAMHITDVRPAIVRGIRTLLLVLMSWILPVAVVIMAGFLCSLPFTGLTALWETRHATSVLLSAAALLVALINAAFQNGDASVALPLRVSARTAAILILPIVAVGVYALGLRVGQYGWTSDRVIAAACLLVAACYAIGYAWAASQYDTWLRPISTVNVLAAFLVLAVLVALFTPIADPARISVNNQMARLEKGKTKAAEFDFRYLRFEGGRYGRAALEELKQRRSGADAALLQREAGAALALTDKDRWSQPKRFTAPVSVAANLTAWPTGVQLPASFLAQKWETVADRDKPDCLTSKNEKCDALVLDVNGDGKPEILLIDSPEPRAGRVYAENAGGVWSVISTLGYQDTSCKPLMEKLRKGEFIVVEPRMKELNVGGRRINFEPKLTEDEACEKIR